MKNFVQEGCILSLPAPYDRTSGQGALIGSLFAVAQETVTNGNTATWATEGVFTLTKATGQAWTVGVKLYWDNSAKNVTTTLTSNTLIGVAAVAAASGDATGVVYVDGCIR